MTFKDEKGEKIETQKISYLDEATEPIPKTVEGKKFVGWSTDGYKCVTEDMDVIAKYIPEEDYAMIAFESDEALLKKDETFKISSQIAPISQSETLVYWESEDNSVVVVSDQGVVTAIGSGETTVVATVSETGEKAKCKIRVLGDTATTEPTKTPEVVMSASRPNRRQCHQIQNIYWMGNKQHLLHRKIMQTKMQALEKM